jgi:hypothetical protein
MKLPLKRFIGALALWLAAGMSHQATADDWAFELAPYLWVAGIDGDATIDGEEYDLSSDFSDIIDQTKFGGSFIFAANRGPWVNFVQLDYLALEDDDVETRFSRSEVKIESDSLLLTATTGYRFTLGKRHSLDLMAGLRYVGLDAEIDDRRRSSNSSRDIYDAVVMVRPIVQLADNWQLMPSFSVGTGDTDLTWEVFPEIVYQPGEWKFRFGYRNLNFDYEDGDDELDLSMRGLLLGVGFVF